MEFNGASTAKMLVERKQVEEYKDMVKFSI